MASSEGQGDFKGNFADADITDPLFPRLPTYDSFMIMKLSN